MPHTVLLVDDDIDLLPSLQFNLEELGFRIFTAEDGLQGLMQVEAHRPDCVVVDVRMPQLNGYQFVQALRGDPATAHIPLIILSAMAQERDKYTGLAVGVDHYLTKPVDIRDLVAIIQQAAAIGENERSSRLQRLAESDAPDER